MIVGLLLGWFDGDYCHHKALKIVGAPTERKDKAAMKHLVSVGHVPVHATGTSEWNTELRRAIRKISKEEPDLSIEQVYVKAFERVKSHDHAPVLEGEIARRRTMDADARLKHEAAAQVAVTAAGETSTDRSGTPIARKSADSTSNLLDTEAVEDDTISVVPGPVSVVPVARSASSTSSLGTAVHKVGFPQALYKCIEQDGKIFVPVKRRGNLHRPLRLDVRHKDSTAIYDRDYSFEGKPESIEFLSGEDVKEIEVNIVNHDEYHPNHHFFIELSQSSDDDVEIKWINAVTKIRIIDDAKWRGCADCFSGLWQTLTSAEPAESPYLEQIRCALRGDDGDDDGDDDEDETPNPHFEGGNVGTAKKVDDGDDGSSAWEWFIYLYLLVPSVLLAVLSIPVTKWNGWGAFFTSLGWIGVWTLLAGDLATGMSRGARVWSAF